jgi:hypothetical protein
MSIEQSNENGKLMMVFFNGLDICLRISGSFAKHQQFVIPLRES